MTFFPSICFSAMIMLLLVITFSTILYYCVYCLLHYFPLYHSNINIFPTSHSHFFLHHIIYRQDPSLAQQRAFIMFFSLLLPSSFPCRFLHQTIHLYHLNNSKHPHTDIHIRSLSNYPSCIPLKLHHGHSCCTSMVVYGPIYHLRVAVLPNSCTFRLVHHAASNIRVATHQSCCSYGAASGAQSCLLVADRIVPHHALLPYHCCAQ